MDSTDEFYDGQIISANIIASRFNTPGAFELDFGVGIFKDGQPFEKHDVYLELSSRYGVGASSQLTQKQLTDETLAKLGFKGGNDYSRIAELVNAKCRVRVQRNDKEGKALGEPRCYFTFRKEKRVLAANEWQALLAQMSGGAVPVTTAASAAPAPFAFNAQAQQVTAPTAPVNPFGNL